MPGGARTGSISTSRLVSCWVGSGQLLPPIGNVCAADRNSSTAVWQIHSLVRLWYALTPKTVVLGYAWQGVGSKVHHHHYHHVHVKNIDLSYAHVHANGRERSRGYGWV